MPKVPFKNFSKSKFKNRATRCTLINHNTPIRKFQSSGTYGLGWGGDTEKKNFQGSEIRTGPLRSSRHSNNRSVSKQTKLATQLWHKQTPI